MGIYIFKDRIISSEANPWGAIIPKYYKFGLDDWTLGGATSYYYHQFYSDRFRFGQSSSTNVETNLSLTVDLTLVDFLKIEWDYVYDGHSYHDANFRISGISGIRYYRVTWPREIQTLETSGITGTKTIQLAARNYIRYDIWRIWGENNNKKLIFYCGV